jgi:ABC-type Zn uptake system ZnuABC Zn-binding protein ZnuA
MKKIFIITILVVLISLITSGCQSPASTTELRMENSPIKVVAAESFLTDITQNIAGDRLYVGSIIPRDMDPHSFIPTPQDVAKIAESDLVIVNGAGLEEWLDNIIQNSGGEFILVEASEGLTPRDLHEPEVVHEAEDKTEQTHEHPEGDPHFWLDPILVIQYTENIRDGLIKADPSGKDTYEKNATEYIAKLEELDSSIRKQLAVLPPEKRLIVTNHESFGYFADRYDFTIIGTIIPSVSTGASPSARQLASLIDAIKETGASAIFIETGANTKLAEQISRETGVKVVTNLYTHSITDSGGEAPSYLAMIQHNVDMFISTMK